jgi:hypothetical protein
MLKKLLEFFDKKCQHNYQSVRPIRVGGTIIYKCILCGHSYKTHKPKINYEHATKELKDDSN